MIEQFRRFMATTAGKIVAVIGTVLLVGLCVYSMSQFLKGDSPAGVADTMYVCSETGKAFKHTNVMGEVPPVYSPFSGKNTGYPAEPCFWTKDGQVKTEPTWVLLNSKVGKPEPTFCPDCGRLVVGHNPEAVAGHQPPPTRAEWFARHQQQ